MAYILPLAVWVYLYWNLCSGLQKTQFCNKMRYGRPRSSKVNDFDTNRKRVCDFLLVLTVTMVLSYIVSGIRRLIGPLKILPIFPTPLSFGALAPYVPFGSNFAANLTVRKLESWGYPPVRRHDCSMSHFDTVPACDRQTDWQTDGFNIASTALCIASYADAL